MRTPFAAVPALAIGLLLAPAARADACKVVDASIKSTFFMVGCMSPVGICTRGEIRHGPLKGTTEFTALTLMPGPTDTTAVYTGVLVITTKHGTVTIHDRGVIDMTTGKFFEFDKVVNATKELKGSHGLLTSQGVQTPTGFDATLTGAICKDGRDHDGRDHDGKDHDKDDDDDRDE